MSDHVIQPVAQGVRFIISLVYNFARYPFPGTDVPVIVMILAPWTIYFFWRWCTAKLFDMSPKE